MPDGMAAIAVWEQLRSGDNPNESQAGMLRGIRAILGAAAKPSDLPKPTWDQLLEFVAKSDDDGLLDLVRSFEWSVGGPELGDLRSQNLANLRSRRSFAERTRCNPSGSSSGSFLFVFRLLSQPGPEDPDGRGQVEPTESADSVGDRSPAAHESVHAASQP